jgi:sirohydrochlorin cobaltochelatase
MSIKTALVLAGHGSHISPNTAGLVWEQVDELRGMCVVDEVTAAFWKEMPSFHTVFDSLEATDITVVPLFTAQGYFTQTVIPTEMGLTGAITERDGRIIRYTRTPGENPVFFEIVEQRVKQALQVLKSPPEETAVAIIGHSTRINSDSRKAAEAQAAHIRTLGLANQVEAVFLDDSPSIADIYTLTNAFNLIAVPYFMARGSHTTIDVPRELGLVTRNLPELVNGRKVYYTRPIGENLSGVILELAREVGTPIIPDEMRIVPWMGWESFPKAGKTALNRALLKSAMKNQSLLIGQLHINGLLDNEKNPGSQIEYVISVDGRQSAEVDGHHFGALRTFFRDNPFRSLSTSNQLRQDWSIRTASLEMVYAVIETIYPGVIADWAKHREGTFRANTLVQTVARQTGQYRQLEQLTPAQTQTIVKQVCTNCVRHPTWFHGASPSDAIPCPEPCNFWLSAAVKELNEKETK